MTKREHKQLVAKMKNTAKEVARDSVRAKELLMKAGICTKKGTLKKAYQ